MIFLKLNPQMPCLHLLEASHEDPTESPAILFRGGVSSSVCLRVCVGSPRHTISLRARAWSQPRTNPMKTAGKGRTRAMIPNLGKAKLRGPSHGARTVSWGRGMGGSQRTDWRFRGRREAYHGLGPEGSPSDAHPQAQHLRSLASRTAQIYNRQGAAGDPRLGGGGTNTRSPERATATRPRAFLGDQKPSPKEADGDPESMARNP